MADNTADLDTEFERLAKETGIDPELNPDTEPIDTDVEVTDSEIVTLAAADEPVGREQTTTLENGVHKDITIIRYRKCPSCGYQPQHPRDYYIQAGLPIPELKSECDECGTPTCTECQARCRCGFIMCSGCSDGYGDMEQTLCYRHRQDVVQERNFERQVQVAELDLQYAELELRKRKQWLNEQMQKHQQQMAVVDRMLDHLHKMNQVELQKWQTQLQHELDRRQHMLDKYETTAKLDIQRQQQELDAEVKHQKLDQEERRIDLDRMKHDDQMDLKHRKQAAKERSQEYQHQIQKERLRLKKAKMDMKEQNLQGVATKLQNTDLSEPVPEIKTR